MKQTICFLFGFFLLCPAYGQDKQQLRQYTNTTEQSAELAGIISAVGHGIRNDGTPIGPELNRLINEERAAANNKLQQAVATKTDTVFLKPDCPPAKVVKGIKSHVAFGLGRSNVSENQIMNVLAIADYMKQFPESKAVVTGYADNATGSHDLNLKLARKRAEAVAKMLQETYGIDGSRLTLESMKNKEQPFQTNDWNRVVIIVAD